MFDITLVEVGKILIVNFGLFVVLGAGFFVFKVCREKYIGYKHEKLAKLKEEMSPFFEKGDGSAEVTPTEYNAPDVMNCYIQFKDFKKYLDRQYEDKADAGRKDEDRSEGGAND